MGLKINGIPVAGLGLPGRSAYQIAQDGGYQGSEAEFAELLATAASQSYVDQKISEIPTPDVSGQIGEHNQDESAHEDIRELIEQSAGYSKEETLKEETKALYGLSADAVPDDAFNLLQESLGSSVQVNTLPNVLVDAPILTEFTIKENGVDATYIKVSNEYNNSGGCLVLRKEVIPNSTMYFYSGQPIHYFNGTTDQYLVNTFYPTIEESIRNQIIPVSVYYDYKDVYTTIGESEIRSIFVPENSEIPESVRKTGTSYWTRTNLSYSQTYYVDNLGSFSLGGYSDKFSVRPCFVLDNNYILGYTDYLTDKSGETLNIPASQVLGGSNIKIATGSYTGTGTYGASNPNGLTFDFVPQLVVVSPVYIGHNNGQIAAVMVRNSGCFTGYIQRWTITWNGNTVSWYNEEAAMYQGNDKGYTYNYIAIG